MNSEKNSHLVGKKTVKSAKIKSIMVHIGTNTGGKEVDNTVFILGKMKNLKALEGRRTVVLLSFYFCFIKALYML